MNKHYTYANPSTIFANMKRIMRECERGQVGREVAMRELIVEATKLGEWTYADDASFLDVENRVKAHLAQNRGKS